MSEPQTTEAPVNGTPKRQTRSYQTELLAMQAGVNVAVNLLGSVKAEKGSVDILNAAIAVLKGNS